MADGGREPARIQRLAPTVVNRIAAGEVIQRPSAAIKELLENSIDAGATRITITVAQAGLKYLSITDNGSGISADDFPIVCERFTTSKMREYKDLESIATFGFRGEALASISHVAHLSITSMTASSTCAYKASFLDGRLVDAPQPCAGVRGTQIVVEDLFYNIPMRLKSLKNVADEYNRCVTVVSHYATHYCDVSFTLKKQGKAKADVHTSGRGSRTDVIRLLHGQSIARELLAVDASDTNATFSVSMNALISNANFSMKSLTVILFINRRLVECSSIRKVLESVYSAILPKGAHPFAYMDIRLPSDTVDVNVHPTKREVGFLHEAEICEQLERWLQERLGQANSSRTYAVQVIDSSNLQTCVAQQIVRKAGEAPSKSIRTDYLNPAGRLSAYMSQPAMQTLSNSQTASSQSSQELNLTSIANLIAEVEGEKSEQLAPIFSQHVFVGCVDDEFALIQHGTKLFLVNVPTLTNSLVYERCLRCFGQHKQFRLQSREPVSIYSLCRIALDDPSSGWTPEDGDKNDIAIQITELLVSKRAMLKEYFSIVISKSGDIVALPQIIPRYVPPLAMLPMFLLRCGSEVDWASEQRCFMTLSQELAFFYQVHPGMYTTTAAQSSESGDAPTLQWTIEHILFPAMRQAFSPPERHMSNGAVVQIASCENLYRIFERC
ncbi:DNA mismatch repair protein S5 domain-containing protein [Plasmodiophora brassicae]